jgi:glycine hydroxymethyltransferase
MKLAAGGHLTHGHPKITFSGKYYRSVQYDVDEEGRINYDEVQQLVEQNRPKLIWAGTTAYPFIFDWEKFAGIAERVGAWLVADISHIAGLVVGGVHPSPVDFVHVVTSTTHKTLRGPRGAFVAVTNKGQAASAERFGEPMDLAKRIDRAVFPGMQGGPHDNTTAAIGVAFEEASKPEFKIYTEQIVKNAKALAESLKSESLKVFGTENHLMLVDCGKEKGKKVAEKLEEEKIYVNANMIPHDEGSPMKPSGIRIGTPAMTTKGWKEGEFREVGKRIAKIVLGY